jgi:hypothetical protein
VQNQTYSITSSASASSFGGANVCSRDTADRADQKLPSMIHIAAWLAGF